MRTRGRVAAGRARQAERRLVTADTRSAVLDDTGRSCDEESVFRTGIPAVVLFFLNSRRLTWAARTTNTTTPTASNSATAALVPTTSFSPLRSK